MCEQICSGGERKEESIEQKINNVLNQQVRYTYRLIWLSKICGDEVTHRDKYLSKKPQGMKQRDFDDEIIAYNYKRKYITDEAVRYLRREFTSDTVYIGVIAQAVRAKLLRLKKDMPDGITCLLVLVTSSFFLYC